MVSRCKNATVTDDFTNKHGDSKSDVTVLLCFDTKFKS